MSGFDLSDGLVKKAVKSLRAFSWAWLLTVERSFQFSEFHDPSIKEC